MVSPPEDNPDSLLNLLIRVRGKHPTGLLGGEGGGGEGIQAAAGGQVL